MKSLRVALAVTLLNALLFGAVLLRVAPVRSSSEEVVRAQRFELVDPEGKVRAQLNLESDGEAVLRLRDATGAIRVKVGASENGSGLVLMTSETEPGFHALARSGGSFLKIASEDRRLREVVTSEP